MATVEKDPVASAVVKRLEQAWGTVVRRHPELPPVIFTLGSGTMERGVHRLGHFAPGRWHLGDSSPDAMPEVFVSGEGLRAGGVEVLGTLLHEGAHALAFVRGVQDTSRGGRYHNAKYRMLAESMGLRVAQIGSIGWSDTAVTEATALVYARTIANLDAACTLWRSAEARGGKDKKPSGNLAVAECLCPRKIRVAVGTLAEGPILCAVCESGFEITSPV